MMLAGLRSLTSSAPSVGWTFQSVLREAGVWSRVSVTGTDRRCCGGWLIGDVSVVPAICPLT